MRPLSRPTGDRAMLPPRPSWAAMRVLKTSTVLTPLEKLVALEIYGLDNRHKPAGSACYASAATLCDRLGTKTRTIERVRRDLLAYGILSRVRGFQRAYWAVTLPADCCPSTERVSPDDLIRHHQTLDIYLGNFTKPSAAKLHTEEGNDTTPERAVSQGAKLRKSGATNYADPVQQTTPPAPPLIEVGEEVGGEVGTSPSTLPREVGVNKKTQNDKTGTRGEQLGHGIPPTGDPNIDGPVQRMANHSSDEAAGGA